MAHPTEDSDPLHAEQQPVQIGTVTLPFGPYRVTRTRAPAVVRQDGIGASFLWSYGAQPDRFVLEGYATSPEPPYFSDGEEIERIVQQFPDGTAAVPLLVPYRGIHQTVRLVSVTDDADSMQGPGEVAYRFEFEACDGPFTDRGGS